MFITGIAPTLAILCDFLLHSFNSIWPNTVLSAGKEKKNAIYFLFIKMPKAKNKRGTNKGHLL